MLSTLPACGAWAGSLLLVCLLPDLLLLFASCSCSARLPWLDTSTFSSFTGASGSGQREGQMSPSAGARPKGSPSDGIQPARSIRGLVRPEAVV